MPDAMDGEETSFLPLALEIDGEAANLSDELLFIPAPDDCWSDDADTVVAVLKEAIDDVPATERCQKESSAIGGGT